jgi:toxin FitB
MILLDTNVISEIYRARPIAIVEQWLDRQRPADLFLCAPVLAELHYGVERLDSGPRRDFLERVVSRIEDRFADQILPFEQGAARIFGHILARRNRMGRPITTMDAQIAAVAVSQHATLATRDIRGFSDLGLDLINPFEAAAER